MRANGMQGLHGDLRDDPELAAAAADAVKQIVAALRDPATIAHINFGHSDSYMRGYNEGYDEGWAHARGDDETVVGSEIVFGEPERTYGPYRLVHAGSAIAEPADLAAIGRVLRDMDDYRSSGLADGYATDEDIDRVSALVQRAKS